MVAGAAAGAKATVMAAAGAYVPKPQCVCSPTVKSGRPLAAPQSKKGHKELHYINKHSLPWVLIDNRKRLKRPSYTQSSSHMASHRDAADATSDTIRPTTHAIKIQPANMSLQQDDFTWPPGQSPSSWFQGGYVSPADIKHIAWADNVPVKHFYIAARLLGATSPLLVAPYKVDEINEIAGIRTYLWVKENIDPPSKIGMHGFTLGKFPGKWVGDGFVVKYDAHRNMQPMDQATLPPLQWVGIGAGIVDMDFQNEIRIRPTWCSYPACIKRDNPFRPKFKHCARCARAYYCSKECQEAHWWSAHNKACIKV